MSQEGGVENLPLRQVAVTANGAFNFIGSTLHHLFRIPIPTPNNYVVLNVIDRHSLQLEFQDVIYLIIVEISLVGPGLLRWVDLRCREIFPLSAREPFGGLNVIVA